MNVKKEASFYEGVIISTGLCFLFPSVSTHFHSLSSSSSTPSVPGTPWPLLSLGSVCLHRECEKSRRRRIINSETTLALFFRILPFLRLCQGHSSLPPTPSANRRSERKRQRPSRPHGNKSSPPSPERHTDKRVSTRHPNNI